MSEGSHGMNPSIESLVRRVAALEDANAVRRLHFAYGYYIDKCLYDEVVELFAEDSEQHFLNGIYRGKAGARRLYCDWFRNLFTQGRNGPVYGFLLDHLMLQDIVDVAPDGRTAKLRARCFMQGGVHRSKPEPIAGLPEMFWEGGIYENRYVKEDGVWKIALLNYNMLWQADYEGGWFKTGAHLPLLTRTFPDDPLGPDALDAVIPSAWPHTRVVPLHYAHPVTGLPHGAP